MDELLEIEEWRNQKPTSFRSRARAYLLDKAMEAKAMQGR